MSRALLRWHRRIGIVSALFVLSLAVTGLLLLLAQPLGLDQKTIGGGIIAKAYNQAPQLEPVGYNVGDDIWVVMVDGLVYVGSADPIFIAPPLTGVTLTSDGLVKLSNAEEVVILRRDGMVVERAMGGSNSTVNASVMPKDVRAQVLTRYRGRGIPTSRVLLDLHSGSIFGKAGPWIMGLASVLLILLSLSGIIMWSLADRRRRKRAR